MFYCSRDELYRPQTDQQTAPARSSSAATKPVMSPYLQKLPHSNFIQTILPPSASSAQQRRHRRRRRSTSVARTRGELLDSAYQPTNNVDHLDLGSFFGNTNRSSSRPTSAPTRTYVFIKIYINKKILYAYFLVQSHRHRENAQEYHIIKQVQKVKHSL